MSTTAATTMTQPGSAAAVLAAVKERRAIENRAAADVLTLAAEWADLHPPESIHHAAGFSMPGCEHEEPLAGPGTPLVAEFCCAELGAVLGVSSTAAKRLIGNALELRHRLPRLWAAVQSGQVPAWRARLVAEATAHASPALTLEAAGWIDAQVAAVAGKVGAAQLDRLVTEAITRFQLDTTDPDDERSPGETRHVTIEKDVVSRCGTIAVNASLDLIDALDLDHTLAHHAAVLKALGSTDSLDARRATALGHLVRTQTSMDLAGLLGHDSSAAERGSVVEDGQPPSVVEPSSVVEEARQRRLETPAARQLVLHIHLTAAAVGDGGISFDHLGRMEEGMRLLLLDQVRSWCGDSHTKVVLKPVIDLNQPKRANGYAIPDRIREHVTLRDRTCVFPHCTRPARRCQVDHITSYDHDAQAEGRPQPGPTETQNLAALCTFHHRLKTHTGWRYTMVDPGVFEWTSPDGHRYLRDPEGTTPIASPGFETGLRPSSTSEVLRPSSTNDDPRH
ncbi:HNH endonuclease [Nocardioides seonyuensis]|uniref:HNH endonuclease n=1 Tax=Nocardioides seonyuensis TaxID=2518371 RepID=A0A4P7IB72_9ACTN|nr:HNH endonuclease signature motif containing protein [Nocardioides seonyuensis]QBX54259.1 HNH endonuclease [Nocardioides seonyuensis]